MLFDKLLDPIAASLDELDRQPLSQAASKLKFSLFIRTLLFRLFSQIRSLRDLTLDLKTSSSARLLRLSSLGLSTLHDAFLRYPSSWVQRLVQQLAPQLTQLSELSALGQLWCVDSSHWPVVRQLGWLSRQGLKGVRLHLAFSLNTLCSVAFFLTYDHSPTAHERAMLMALVQTGVTYILDRGYISLPACRELIDRGAFFVVRARNNQRWRVLSEIEITASEVLNHLSEISDQVVQLRSDAQRTVLRLVCFKCGKHRFCLLTNRFELRTEQIVLLYAWRWQVELVFRAWKHTLSGLHLINLSEEGIATQFQILVLAAMLWALMQQQTDKQLAQSGREEETTRTSRKSVTARLSQVFQTSWRMLRKSLRVLANCLAQPYSVYVKERYELRI
jgi:hypothetical protein